MELFVSALVLSITAGVHALSNHEGQGSARSMYGHFEEESEPFAYAAVPLHQPMPIIRIVSPSSKYKFGAPYEAQLEPTHRYYARQPAHSASMIEPRVTEPSDSSSEQLVPEVIYARPNKRGGFTYRRPAAPRPRPQDPIVIRVHKYKVVKNR